MSGHPLCAHCSILCVQGSWRLNAIRLGPAGRSRVLSRGCGSLIKAPWALDEERFLAAPVFMPRPPTRREMLQKDEELILRGSPTSTIGRTLKALTFDGKRPTGKQITEIVEGLLHAASRYGLAIQVASPIGGDGWRLVSSSITFGLARGRVEPERDNSFFQELYRGIASCLLVDGGGALYLWVWRAENIPLRSKAIYAS